MGSATRWLGRVACAALAGLACMGAAQAQNYGGEHWNYDYYRASYTVNRDGSYVANGEVSMLAKDQPAVKAMGQISLGYNATMEQVEIVSAWTQKPDGRKVELTPDLIRDQEESPAGNAPMFQGTRTKVLIFPEFNVGDHIVYRYRFTCRTPQFPGQFTATAIPNAQAGEYSLSFDLPKDMPLHEAQYGFIKTAPHTEGDRTIYHWEMGGTSFPGTEPGDIDYRDFGVLLYVSTFADQAAMAAAYDARARDKALPTPRVNALVQQVTQGMSEPRDKVYAIANWERKNIRYVAIYLGAGGVVPHSADTVLENRYGDCKDHATLLEAMLAAAGIDSTQVLINHGFAFKLPGVPVTYNHAISYVPSLDLYLDTTSPNVEPPWLPAGDLDKQVLLVKSGKIGHTPPTQVVNSRDESVIRINADGSAAFTDTHIARGPSAEEQYKTLQNLTKEQLDDTVKNGLAARGFSGAGKFSFQHGKGDGATRQQATGHIDDLADMPGPIGIPTSGAVTSTLQGSLEMLTATRNRTEDFLCDSHIIDEELRFMVADGIEIVAIPHNLKLDAPNISYSADYAREGQQVTVKRHLAVLPPSLACKLADFSPMLAAEDRINRDLRAQLILRRKGQQ